MITERNGCCGCDTDSYPCIDTGCPKRHETVLICDFCGNEVQKLYKANGMQLCSKCVLGELEEVDI